MYLVQAFKPKNDFINYFIGIIIIAIAWQIFGSIPLMAAIGYKSFTEKLPFPTNELELLTFLEPNLFLTLMIVGFGIGLLALYFINKNFHYMSWLEITTSRLKIDYKRILFAFLIWSLFIVATTVIDMYSSPENYQFNFKPLPFFILLLITIFLLPIQTSFEEYLFRGYLMQGFGVLFNDKLFTLLVTSISFGALHYFNPEVDKLGNLIMFYYIGMGLFLGIITLMDEGLELTLGVHAANNMLTALILTSDWSVMQTHSIFKEVSKDPKIEILDIVLLFITFTIFIFIFAKKYNWNNWQQKLTGKIYSNSISNKPPTNN